MKRACAAILITVVAGLPWLLTTPEATAGSVRLTSQEKAIVTLVNKQRVARGLVPLRVRCSLTKAARLHSRDMAEKQYFSHTSRNGRTPSQRMQAAGYTAAECVRWSVGENIAWANAGCATASAVVRRWMRSAAHRRIILTPAFRDVGIGIARGAVTCQEGNVLRDVTFYTLDLGCRVLR